MMAHIGTDLFVLASTTRYTTLRNGRQPQNRRIMWIILNDAFFSIVDKAGNRERDLVVRSRRADDIPKVFGVDAVHSPHNDYAFRAEIPRASVASVIAQRITEIDYSNFKNSVDDPKLHDAYSDVWGDLYRLNEKPREK